jgi:type II secretory pathway pseudopilin PulG
MPLDTTRPPARRAFSVVELLIVVGIIGLLVGLTLFVGKSVLGNTKQKVTQDILQTLDAALTDYISNRQDQPPGPVYTKDGTPRQYFPMADAVNPDILDPRTNEPTLINSIGMFLVEARKVPSTAKILDSIPSQYVKVYDPDGSGAGSQPELVTVFDGWGRPIRYVHPLFQGVTASSTPTTDFGNPTSAVPAPPWNIANIRRTNSIPVTATPPPAPDADGGMCVGNRPYFYSAGEDGYVGVQKDAANKVFKDYNKDNIYSMPPNFTDK